METIHSKVATSSPDRVASTFSSGPNSPALKAMVIEYPRERSNSVGSESLYHRRNNLSSTVVLQEGMKVLIIPTENVLQRVPHLVNTIGIIKEVPVHPATWFKVEFPDHKVVTFRPSALQPLDEDGKPLASYTVKPSITKASKSPALNAARHTAPKEPKASEQTKSHEANHRSSDHHPHSSSTNSKKTLLSTTDPDSWVGRRVAIIGGRFSGQAAYVKSSGNGWVQIDTSVGEIAKRAYELEVLQEGEEAPAGHDSSSSNRLKRKRSRPERFEDDYDSDDNNYRCSSSSSHRNYDQNKYSSCKSYSLDSFYRQSHFAEEEAHRLNELLAERSRIPLVSLDEREAKRSKTIDYVNRSNDRLGNRPHLQSWKNKINSTLTQLESETVRSMYYSDLFCAVCSLERWPGTSYCWNQFCAISPLYYKTVGMIPQQQSHNSAMLLAEEEEQEEEEEVEDETDHGSVGEASYEAASKKEEFVEPLVMPPPLVPLPPSSAAVLATSNSAVAYTSSHNFPYNRDRAESMALTDCEERSPLITHDKGLNELPDNDDDNNHVSQSLISL